ncbi:MULTISPECIES: D-alanine--D-alanine ligase family protein [Curtobacterium]|uniref:D-alanine--D-alanine ligase family protein n=1 Tax=Curtobacterium TaxID=2034 RepID=UPI0018E51964|nr:MULTISPECIES: D-alanine--D-alanine ligase family protein [Curtobacterium]MCA5923893.1 D-alanine--D-alanine ligase [Curtobacterium oceanosedimentum]QQD75959.1 D-alanine--D-alanine ligase [Curtobacterium sp. YC1]
MTPTESVRVVVIGGGANSEHEVGLASAASVAAALDPSRYEVLPLTIDRDGGWRSGGEPCSFAEVAAVISRSDVVFPVVHGPGGEDGSLAALAALAGVPVVGSPVGAGAVAMDKWVTKLVARASGVAVAAGVLLTDDADADWLRSTVGPMPWIVKPVAGGSSFGVSRVDEPGQLTDALGEAFAHDRRILVERMVVGREVDVAVLERTPGELVVGPPLEVVNDAAGFFDADTKYDGSARFVLPARLDAAVADRLDAVARAVFTRLGCTGIARVDCFVTPDGEVVLNEVNTMPGLTAQSQVPKMFAAVGVDYPELLGILVETALASAPSRSEDTVSAEDTVSPGGHDR